MTVVVADSSPLNYLTIIGSVEVLHRLYGTVIVPLQVIDELKEPAAPPDVRGWAENPPDWIDVRVTAVNDAGLLHLDLGERAAITLAQSNPETLLLIDELAGRIEAARRGIRTTGTLGVLRAAALREFVDLPTALARLLETNFRVSLELVEALLAEDAERRPRPV
jgi:predicted nucleic acid-binding protein